LPDFQLALHPRLLVKRKYLYLGGGGLVLAFVALWLWWNRPQRTDMSLLAPAECIAFAEIEDLPQLAKTVAANPGWNSVFPSLRGLFTPARNLMISIAARTGVGPSEAVVFGRAQVAVAVLGVDSSNASETMTVKPRLALIIDTHSSSFRTNGVVKKLVGDFAAKAYIQPQVKYYESDDAGWTEWVSPDGNRHIYAAVADNLAFIGNDDNVIRLCLSTARRERKSLAASPQLIELRERLVTGGTLAFGFLTAEGTSTLLEIAARAYAPGLSDRPEAQSAAASLLPEIVRRVSGPLAWATRASSNRFEDLYDFRFSHQLENSNDAVFEAQPLENHAFARLLPDDAESFTSYDLRDPAQAWRGIRVGLSARLDATSSFFVTKLLDLALEPYGISDPEKFLGAVTPPIVTARLSNDQSLNVAIVPVKDEGRIREALSKDLRNRPKGGKFGDANLLLSPRDDGRAAAFVDGFLILGSEESVRRCLIARAGSRVLANVQGFPQLFRPALSKPAASVSVSSEASLLMELQPKRLLNDQLTYAIEPGLNHALKTGFFSESQTVVSLNGFQRITVSDFGLFGNLIRQFAEVGR
jgi:hypothetical protein